LLPSVALRSPPVGRSSIRLPPLEPARAQGCSGVSCLAQQGLWWIETQEKPSVASIVASFSGPPRGGLFRYLPRACELSKILSKTMKFHGILQHSYKAQRAKMSQSAMSSKRNAISHSGARRVPGSRVTLGPGCLPRTRNQLPLEAPEKPAHGHLALTANHALSPVLSCVGPVAQMHSLDSRPHGSFHFA